MLKQTSLYLFILVLTLPALSFPNDNSNIFSRLDNSETAKVIEYTCDNETLKNLPFAEICGMPVFLHSLLMKYVKDI
jgi:hypothetical protein